jgi:hypothetical protein
MTPPLAAVADPTPDSVPSGPLVRVLTDPAGSLHRALDAAAHLAHAAVPWVVGGLGVVVVGAAFVAVMGRRQRARLRDGARVVIVLAPPEVDPAGGEALWRNLHDLLRPRWRRLLAGQPYLGFEYRWSNEGLRIALWVPGPVPPGMVERAVESAWPAARVTVKRVSEPDDGDPAPAEDALLPQGWPVAGGRLRLARPGWYPLRTDFDADPLRAVVGAGAVTGPGEAAAIQVLARPAGRRAMARCRRAARDVRLGRSPRPAARLLDLVQPGPAARPSLDPGVAPEVRAILAKCDSPLWAVTVRYAVAAPAPESGNQRAALRGRAHMLASSFALLAGRNSLVRRRERGLADALRKRRFNGRGDLLSTAELAALAHLPLDRIVPSLARAGARPVAPPPAVSATERGGKVLGDADTGGGRPVVLRPADARYHLHLMGATGSGKSTLLTRLILEDVEAGRGAVVIDPKGDLVTDVLARLPKAVIERAVILDPQLAPGRRQPTLNMLERVEGVGQDLIVDHLVGIFSRIFESHWGPRLEDVLRSACLTLLHRDGATLSDVPRILSVGDEWQDYLADRPEDELHGFWRWYQALGEGQRAQVVGPLLYKLRAFLLRPFVRDLVNAPTSSFDVGDVLDGGLLLARLPKGLLGDDTSRLLGSFVVAKVWQAATARAATPEAARRDASLYVDECQNFLTLPRSFDEILAESRGYHLSLVLAHQHLGQLPRDLRDAVSANARNKVFFTMSPEDAFVLARQTSPQLTDHDLANLGAYQAAARLVVDGQDQPAFTLATRPAPEARAA